MKTIDDPRYHLNDIARGVELGNVQLDGKCYIHAGCVLVGKIRIGFASTLGPFCMLYGHKHQINIGKYTQFGPKVAIYGNNHPTSHLTTYVNKNLFDGGLGKLLGGNIDAPANISIGNDVWIGHGAIILKGVLVGNGAVIGAGAVVVYNVPPYAVVAGNPARVIRYRFPTDIVTLLESLRWWDLKLSDLNQIESLFHLDYQKNPEAFRESILEAIRMFEDASTMRS